MSEPLSRSESCPRRPTRTGVRSACSTLRSVCVFIPQTVAVRIFHRARNRFIQKCQRCGRVAPQLGAGVWSTAFMHSGSSSRGATRPQKPHSHRGRFPRLKPSDIRQMFNHRLLLLTSAMAQTAPSPGSARVPAADTDRVMHRILSLSTRTQSGLLASYRSSPHRPPRDVA